MTFAAFILVSGGLEVLCSTSDPFVSGIVQGLKRGGGGMADTGHLDLVIVGADGAGRARRGPGGSFHGLGGHVSNAPPPPEGVPVHAGADEPHDRIALPDGFVMI